MENLEPLGTSGLADHLTLGAPGGAASTTVTINNQGLVDILEAAVTNLMPKHAYTLALSNQADGKGPLQPLSGFNTNPAGAAIVSTVAQLRVAPAPQNRDARASLSRHPRRNARQRRRRRTGPA